MINICLKRFKPNIMKKTIKPITVLFLSILSIVSCKDDDENVLRFSLNEFEQSVIPFMQEQTMTFTNELFETASVLATKKQVSEYWSGTGDTITAEMEQQSNEFIFTDHDLRFVIVIQKTDSNKTQFNISTYLSSTGEGDSVNFSISPCETSSENLETNLTNITVGSNLYEDVFVLERCSINNNVNTPIAQIIYSPERGVEYVEFDDGTYLKQL